MPTKTAREVLDELGVKTPRDLLKLRGGNQRTRDGEHVLLLHLESVLRQFTADEASGLSKNENLQGLNRLYGALGKLDNYRKRNKLPTPGRWDQT